MSILSSIFGSNDTSSPEFQQLVTRWDNFVAKLKERYFEVLKQSEEPLNNVIENIQYDTVIIHNIKNGLNDQTVQQLSQKADEGWLKMQGEMSKLGVSFNLINEQRTKVDRFKDWVAVEFQKFEAGLYAKAARKIQDNVQKHIDVNKLHRCTQCAAELPIKIFSFMSINLKCESCGSVNTYQPDDRIRAMEYYVINHLAEEYALPEKLKARTDKSAQKEYYKKYYTYLMENVPDKKEFYERDMNERMNNPLFNMGF
ncbi:MAG: hypothetical protein ABIY50_12705 [Ignavibacteria bacterium]